MAFYHLLISFLYLSLLIPTYAHNITTILDAFPQYSVYNSHEKITCLVLSNPVMSSFVAKHRPNEIKNALRHLSLLDYFDLQRLHNLTHGITLTATLYQSPDNVPDNGHIQMTNLRDGRVGFASATPGSVFHPTHVRPVVQIPNNLSVFEISTVNTFPGLPVTLSAPSKFIDLLNAGCKMFASLVTSSGMLLPCALFSGTPAPDAGDLLALTAIPAPAPAPPPGAEAPSTSESDNLHNNRPPHPSPSPNVPSPDEPSPYVIIASVLINKKSNYLPNVIITSIVING